MKEIELLNEFRAEVPAPTEQNLRTTEARMTNALRNPTGRTGRRPMAMRLALAGGLAAAVGVGALTLHGAKGPAAQTPDLKQVSAVEVLDQAALAAERAPELHPRPDQFFVYESVTMQPAYTKDGSYLDRVKRTVWLSVDHTRTGAFSAERLPAKALPGTPVPPGANDGVGTVDSGRLPICDPHPADNARLDFAYLSSLPTDPAQLLGVLKQRQSGDPSQDRRAWTAIGDLLRESYLAPAQRAALFRAAKLIPSVAVVTDAVDAAGRSGIAVAWADPERGTRHELIFNATTLLFQGERTVVVDPAKAAAAAPVPVGTGGPAPAQTRAGSAGTGLPVGTELASTAELSVKVVDTAPAFPPSGRSCG